MAILQRVATYPNERYDMPDLRAAEAFSQNDWAYFLKGAMCSSSYILSGFEITNYQNIFLTGGVNIKQSNVSMFHTSATTQAQGFYVSAATEADASLVLSPSATNFIEADMTTTTGTPDSRAFWDMGTNEGKGAEFTSTVDTVVNLELSVTSNISGFTTGRIPLYKIVTDSTGVAISCEDCRSLFFRLGNGGSSPSADSRYSWLNLPDASHSRLETPLTSTSATTTNAPFQGGDKNIKTFKQWMDAMMSEFASVKGTSYWYQDALSVPEAYQNSALTLLIGGTWTHEAVPPAASTGYLDLTGGTTVLRLGLTHTLGLSPFTALNLNVNPVLYCLMPGDVGATYGFGQDGATPIAPKQISAVTSTSVTVATGGNYITSGGVLSIRNVQFAYTAYNATTGAFTGVTPDPSGLVKVNDWAYQDINGVTGYYHYGQSNTLPGMNGEVSEGAERVLWLAYFDGTRIHTWSSDLVAGEQIVVGDNTPAAVLTYIGSTGEADSTPIYNVNSIANGTNLTAAITAAFHILETPIYDENIEDDASLGWPINSILTLPPNSRASNAAGHYTIGTGELVVYENGIIQQAGKDYFEVSSSSIQLNRDSYAGSTWRFRIANVGGAGAAAGLGSAGFTLNNAYSNGATITTLTGVPVSINGPVGEFLLEVIGNAQVTKDMQVQGRLYDMTQVEMVTSVSNPVAATKAGFWRDSTGNLMFTNSDGSILPVGQTIAMLNSNAQVLTRTMQNSTGATIPQYSAVYISANGQIDLAVANNPAKARVLGITLAAIPTGQSGLVAYTGVVAGMFTGLGMSPGYIFLSDTPGQLSITPPSTTGDTLFIVGQIDGNDLIIEKHLEGRL